MECRKNIMDLPKLRIALLGNNELENAKIGNFILGRDALQTEVSEKQVSERVIGKVGKRLVTIVNPPDLFNLDEHSDEFTDRVHDCVDLCKPGPHAFILVVKQPENFSEEDRVKVKAILERFSKDALQYTIVLTVKSVQHASASFSEDHPFGLMLRDCDMRHLMVELYRYVEKQVVKLFEEVDRMVGKNGGRHLNWVKTEIMPETPGQPGSKRPREDDMPEDEESQKKKKKRNETKIIHRAKECLSLVQHQLEGKVKHQGSSSKLSDYISTSIQDLLETPMQTTTIGLFGQTGFGKSSLLNTLMGEPDLLPTGQVTTGTSVIIQVEAKSEDNNYKATIDFISKEEWHEELKGLLADLEDKTSSIDQMAEEKINALYGTDAISKSFEELVGSNYSHINDLLTEGTKCFPKHQGEILGAKDLSEKIKPYVMHNDKESGKLYWPIVKIVKIEVPKWKDLPENIVLVDLPGNGDHNQSRDEMWRKMLSQCKDVWIVSSIIRPASDKCAWDIFDTNLKDMVQGGECTSIAFICTKTDVMDVADYMKDEKLKDEDLPFPVTSDSERKRACILHRNAQAKDQVKKKAEKMMEKHNITMNLSVFTVSSNAFSKKKHLEEKDTEIPHLKEVLDRFNNKQVSSQFFSSASGILHLIQAGGKNEDRSKLYTEVLKILDVELKSLRRTLQKCYDQLEEKLCEGVQSAKESQNKVLEVQLSAPPGKWRGFHKTLSALCRNNGYFRSKGETRDVNQALAQVLQNRIDEEFNNLFPNEEKTGQSVQERIDEFTICSIDVNQAYGEPGAVRHILKFLKGEEDRLKTKAHYDIMETKKDMYKSIRDNIKQQMTPGYKKATEFTGPGSMENQKNFLVDYASSEASQMFDHEMDEMLEKFTRLMDRIESDFKNTLEKAVEHALKESPFTFSIDVESQIKRMKELSKKL